MDCVEKYEWLGHHTMYCVVVQFMFNVLYMHGFAIYSSGFLGWRVFNNTLATELSRVYEEEAKELHTYSRIHPYNHVQRT